jgi:3-phenylpropionate/trans-cinnamate dioxygenase ferredoxin subunit
VALQPLALKLDEVPNPGCTAVKQGAFDLLICRSGAHLYAVQNFCPHAGSRLTGGKIRGHFIFCPEHGARFDLRDGSSASALTNKPLTVFRVQADAQDILIELP